MFIAIATCNNYKETTEGHETMQHMQVNKASGRYPDWKFDRRKENLIYLVNMAENEEWELQDVIEEDD